ncbi:hypothetical protein Tco_0009799 [Tanacetum coccineum]
MGIFLIRLPPPLQTKKWPGNQTNALPVSLKTTRHSLGRIVADTLFLQPMEVDLSARNPKEDQEGNNSSEIETLPLFPIHGGSQHDFFGVKASDLSSDHSVGENHREEEDQEGNNSSEIETLPLLPIHGGSQHDFFGVKASDLSSDHSVGDLPPPPLVTDNTRQPQMSDMTACLNNLSYIPLNNEQNEPTQGDIGKLNDFIFNEVLEFFQNVFPIAKGYKLSPSYYAIKKTFKTIRLRYESIHARVNDCFLFWGDTNKDVHCCPVCKTSRWKDSNTLGKKLSKKVLRYFPIISRLQRLYKSSHTTKEMTWHATEKCMEPRTMQHPVNGRAWKDFDTKYPDFAAKPRNSSFMLTLLIPGLKSPGKDIDVYLRPLIDNLKDLWAKPGVETIDVATGLKFNMRAMVLWTINDFPTRSSLSGWSRQGYRACPTCNEDTLSVHEEGVTIDAIPLVVKSPSIVGWKIHKEGKKSYYQIMRADGKSQIPVEDLDLLLWGDLETMFEPHVKDTVWRNQQDYKVLEWKLYDSCGVHSLRMQHVYIHMLEHGFSKIPTNDMKEAFPGWFGKQIRQHHVDNDPSVSESNELFALACGPSQTLISVNSCVVNGMRFVVHSRDERRTTQNNGICSPGPDEEMYYGQLKQILEFSYLSFKTVLFRDSVRKKQQRDVMKNLIIRETSSTQIRKCRTTRLVGYVEHVSHKKFFRNGGVIVVEDDPDVIHVDNSSDLALSTTVDMTGNGWPSALHIDGQSIDVDAPPDIIDVVDEDGMILLMRKDPILMIADLMMKTSCQGCCTGFHASSDGGDEDRPLHTTLPQESGQAVYPPEDPGTLELKSITDKSGPSHSGFEFGDQKDPDVSREACRLIGPNLPWGARSGVITQFDKRPHMESDRWPLIYAAIQQHLQKIYNGKKAALKERHWIPDLDGTYDLERIRLSHPSHISEVNWDAQIAFWNDPKNRARATQNKQNRAKSKVMESSATREYPSLIYTFFLTHTFNGVFLNPEDKAIYGLGSNTETGVPYTEDEIMACFTGRQRIARGHIPGVGRVLPGQGTVIPPPPPCTHSSDVVKLKKREKPEIGGGSGSGGRGDDEQGDDEDDGEDGEDEDNS